MPRDRVARGEVGEIRKGISAPPRSAFQTDFAKRSVSRPIDGSEEGGVMGRQSSGGKSPPGVPLAESVGSPGFAGVGAERRRQGESGE